MAPHGAPPARILLLATALAAASGGPPPTPSPSPRPSPTPPPPPGERLLRALLSRSRPGVRPGVGEGVGEGWGEGRVLVRVGLELAQLIGLDEKNEELTTKVYLNLSWRDPRLQWDPREHGGVGGLRIQAQNIWLPDVGLENNNDGEFGVSLEVPAVVTPDGSVSWRPPALFRSRCPIRVSHFPFDWQNCSLVFRSGSYGPSELRLLPVGGEGGGHPQITLTPDFQGNGQWEICHRSGRRHEGPSHEDVTFYLVLRRQPLFYIVNVLVPCVLLTLMAVGVFYLPHDAGEKLSLSLFTLLTLTVFLLLLADKVPATSLAVPLIGRYLTGTLGLLALCVMLSVGGLGLHHRGPAAAPLPPRLRELLLQRLPPFLGLRPLPPPPSPPPSPLPFGAPPRGGDEYFLRRPPPGTTPHLPRDLPRNPPGPPLPPELREAAVAVGVIAGGLRERRRQQQLQAEWRAAAQAVDRLLLGAFLALTGGCALGTGLDAALHRPPAEPFP